MKTFLLIILTLCIFLIFNAVAFAQPPIPAAPSQAPIDGGLGLLAAAGGSYALKKLRDRKNMDDLPED
ncbi:PID-CTERM protein-sorting domain-containing protein [Gracilimonas tropica]|uniref:PID-CTERM protein-sorting domain-containing protein n=1 Tax=Gracilimonas tropica TaxID=454600 RepID=UPI00035DE6A6|nr:hypothetical protein [Gracilimonas tropica]